MSATATEVPGPVSEFGIVRIGESYLFFISARNVCWNSIVAKPDDREIPASDGGVAGCCIRRDVTPTVWVVEQCDFHALVLPCDSHCVFGSRFVWGGGNVFLCVFVKRGVGCPLVRCLRRLEAAPHQG